LLGSLERFLGVYIEHTAGAFPVWLSPVQVQIVPIADRHQQFAAKAKDVLTRLGIRVEQDDRSLSMQKKLKEAEEQKIPFMLIVGDREVQNKTVSVRQRGNKDLGAQSLKAFGEKLTNLIANKAQI